MRSVLSWPAGSHWHMRFGRRLQQLLKDVTNRPSQDPDVAAELVVTQRPREIRAELMVDSAPVL